MSDSIWFILLNGKKQGPYNYKELQKLSGLTPDTFAWREGMREWIAIRNIPELKDLFKEETETPPLKELFESKPPAEDLVLSLPQAKPPSLFWLMLLVALLIYAFFQLL